MAAVWTPTFSDAVDRGFAANYTSGSKTFGTGYGLVFLMNEHNGAAAVTAVTIAGVSATKLLESGTNNNHRWQWWGAATSGNGTVVITCTSIGTFAMFGGLLTGANTTPAATATNPDSLQADPQSLSITIPSNGVAIIGAGTTDTSANFPYSWTTATRDSGTEAVIGTGNTAQVGGATCSTSGSQTITVAGVNGLSFFYNNMLALAFGPAAATGIPNKIYQTNFAVKRASYH